MMPRLTRRRILSFIGGSAAVTLFGCLRRESSSIASTPSSIASSIASPIASPAVSPIASTATTPACIVRPQQTEGPYFRDEKLNRSDIRSNPADGAVKPGVPLKLAFQVSQVSSAACVPLEGAIVDVWHCDAEGVYSDVSDRRFDTTGQKFLRGYQTTNADGIAEFITIYPGWYPGRTVHIHFKIRTDATAQSSYEFTSQLYFDDAVTDQVDAQAPYAARGQRTQRNDQDGIFQRSGEQLLLTLTPAVEGYEGRFNIGLELT
ncbi:MAG: intradiol ring-cleavage dioxygenase [Oculatellaceae cyanobacterium Prado106]|nr:intradiol ring-cleavage dioxygenase [Oculatellaceae cyanobacterium Prado106]